MKIVKIPKKKKGEYREICVCGKERASQLRSYNKGLEDNLLALEKNNTIPYFYLHGFISGRSPVTNAFCHIGYKYTFSLDIADFFDSIKKYHVKDWIKDEVIKEVFYNGSPKQGLPTSPAVSNLAGVKMDISIFRSFKKINENVIYTRYADDLTFSFNQLSTYHFLRSKIPNIISKNGFKVKRSKTRLQTASFGYREVTGVMVGDSEIKVGRNFRRKMRATLHQKNIHSYAGMVEWSFLKKPTDKNKLCQKTVVKKFIQKKRFYENKAIEDSFKKLDFEGKIENLSEDIFITNDIAYKVGCSDLGEGWGSCFRVGGLNKKTPLFLAHFPEIHIAILKSKKRSYYYGVTRNRINARIFVCPKEKIYFSRSFYGKNSETKNKLIKTLEENGYCNWTQAKKITLIGSCSFSPDTLYFGKDFNLGDDLKSKTFLFSI